MTLRPASRRLSRWEGLGINVTIRTYVLVRQVTRLAVEWSVVHPVEAAEQERERSVIDLAHPDDGGRPLERNAEDEGVRGRLLVDPVDGRSGRFSRQEHQLAAVPADRRQAHAGDGVVAVLHRRRAPIADRDLPPRP